MDTVRIVYINLNTGHCSRNQMRFVPVTLNKPITIIRALAVSGSYINIKGITIAKMSGIFFIALFKNLECLHSTFRIFDCYQALKQS